MYFSKGVEVFYGGLRDQNLSVAVPLDGKLLDDIEILLPQDFENLFSKVTCRTPAQARKIIRYSAAAARNGISIIGPNKGNFMEVNKSNPVYQTERNKRNNAKWNPINNPLNNPKNNKALQDRVAEKNRLKLDEMFENGLIQFKKRTTAEINTIVDGIFLSFTFILVSLAVYIGYTGVSLALEPYR